jgi:NADH:ubiquinone oxidoreductase subunit 6 (subunit J)
MEAMKTFLTILFVLALAGTLGVLLVGVFGLARGGGDPRRSNMLMRWRVILQATALLLLLLLMSLIRS